jgi:hypothetical protein
MPAVSGGNAKASHYSLNMRGDNDMKALLLLLCLVADTSPRLIGTCNGAVMRADEEDYFPICEEIRPYNLS